LKEVQLPELALRLALCSHIRVPNENEIDHLAEIEKVFAPKKQRNGLQRRPSGSSRLPKQNNQEEDRQVNRLTRQRGQQWPLRPAQEGTMIQFTYKLKLNERVYPRYNPEKDEILGRLACALLLDC
jgi:hypothetical protein